jgi:hypothetical protein
VYGIFYWQDRSDGGYSTEGWGDLEAIDPFTANGSEYNSSDLDPARTVAHPLTDGITAYHQNTYRGGVTAKPGTTVVAWWTDGAPLIGYTVGPLGQRQAAISAFPGYSDFYTVGDEFWKLWENAVRWAAAGSTPAAPAPSGQMAIPTPAFNRVQDPLHPKKPMNAPAARSGTWGG